MYNNVQLEHLSLLSRIPKRLLVMTKPPPHQKLPYFDKFFSQFTQKRGYTASDQSCSRDKFDKLIEKFGNGNIYCWFITMANSSRKADDYHRWHNKGKKHEGAWTRRNYVLSHYKKPCSKYGYVFHLFEFEYAKRTIAYMMMKRLACPSQKNSRTSVETGSGSHSIMHQGKQWPIIGDEEVPGQVLTSANYRSRIAPTHGDSADFSWQIECANIMPPLGAFNNDYYNAMSNIGIGSEGFFPYGNHSSASTGTIVEFASPNVSEAYNHESVVMVPLPTSNYHGTLCAAQGDSAGFSPIQCANMPPLGVGAINNGYYNATGNNGIASEGFFFNSNSSSASTGRTGEFASLNVHEANNDESVVPLPPGNYHDSLYSTQGDSDRFSSWTMQYANRMPPLGAINNGYYNAIGNGIASEGLFPNGNYSSTSTGRMGEFASPNVYESVVALPTSNYHSSLCATQGEVSQQAYNAIPAVSLSTFPNGDYIATPSGTAGNFLKYSNLCDSELDMGDFNVEALEGCFDFERDLPS